MNAFHRGVQLYVSGLAFVGTLAVVWATNRFLLGFTTAGTGWPLMAAIAGLLVPLGAIARHRWADHVRDDPPGPYPWSSDDR